MRTSGSYGGVQRCAGTLVAVLLLVGVCGCPARTMMVEVDQYINASPANPKGQPLAVDIVSVFPQDLEGKDSKAANEELKPETPITADVWFAKRPTREAMKQKDNTERFRIKKQQIYSFTKEPAGSLYGVRAGGLLVGGAFKPGQKDQIVKGIPIDSIFDSKAVIYVFCKFQDAKGNILPTKPVVFWTVGDFRDQLKVHIHKQSIERVTKRTFGKDMDWMIYN